MNRHAMTAARLRMAASICSSHEEFNGCRWAYSSVKTTRTVAVVSTVPGSIGVLAAAVRAAESYMTGYETCGLSVIDWTAPTDAPAARARTAAFARASAIADVRAS